MNEVNWKPPESIPFVELGTEKTHWIAVRVHSVEKTFVFLSQYQNRPILDEEQGWEIYDTSGEMIASVGWVEHTRHDDFEDFYTPEEFNEHRVLLGWAEYEPPLFVKLPCPFCEKQACDLCGAGNWNDTITSCSHSVEERHDGIKCESLSSGGSE